ncbi:MAG: class I SAM-dependent methyltransferase [Actinomycetes bacterium]
MTSERAEDQGFDPDFAYSEEAAIRRHSFGAWAQDYDRYRPGYPPEVLEFLLSQVPGDGTVVDIGAGTGQLARGLLGLGANVIGVEPDDRMREVLAGVVGSDRALAGTAERIPLPDASVDAVFGSQMWHWVDITKAVPEVARVLKPGGTLGIIWNLRDDRVDWIRAMNEFVPIADSYKWFTSNERPVLGDPFGPVSLHEFVHTHPIDAEALVGLVGTISVVALGDDAPHRLQQVRELANTHPSLAGRASFDMPYVCKVFTARRR